MKTFVFFRIGGAWDWVFWLALGALIWQLPWWQIIGIAICAGGLQYQGERYGERHAKPENC